MIFSVAMVNAQSSKIQAAKNYNNANPPKLAKALKAIEKAIVHKRTLKSEKLHTKAWFIRGNVFLKIALTKDEEYKKLSDNPLQEAVKSYNKCKELDKKGVYTPQIVQNMGIITQEYYNKGVSDFQSGKYDLALAAFENAYNTNYELNDVVDTTALFNMALCATNAKDDARALKEFKRLADLGYKKPSVYVNLTNLYKKAGDTVAAFATISKGRETLPTNFDVLITETNLFLETNKTTEALANLEKALEFDKTNPQIFFAVGAQYDAMINSKNIDKVKKDSYRDNAIKNYEKAIALKADYFDPIFNLGAINVNLASEIISEANALPIDATKEYDALIVKADGYLKTALPYLEKAHQMQPKDLATLGTLKEIYVRLRMNDKVKEVNDKINALK